MILAQTDLAIIIPAFLGLVTVVVGFGKMLVAHTGDTNKHPSCDDVVFKDVCITAHEAIEAQFESMEKHNQERHEELKQYTKERFDEIKDQINGDRGKTG